MSLYIGKDDTNTKTLFHVAKGTHTIDSMKSGYIPGSTVFRLNDKFVVYAEYSPTSLTVSDGITYCGFSSDLIDYLISTEYMYVIVTDGSNYTGSGSNLSSEGVDFGNWFDGPSLDNSKVDETTYGYTYKVLEGEYSNVSILVLNIPSYYSTYDQSINYNDSLGVELTNSTIVVGGVDLGAFKYLRADSSGVEADRFYINNGTTSCTLVNRDNTSDTCQLTANSSKVEITNNYGPIFSTAQDLAPNYHKVNIYAELYEISDGDIVIGDITPQSHNFSANVSFDNTLLADYTFYKTEYQDPINIELDKLFLFTLREAYNAGQKIIFSGVFKYVDGLIGTIGITGGATYKLRSSSSGTIAIEYVNTSSTPAMFMSMAVLGDVNET